MTDIERARRLFRRAGLSFPTIPRPLAVLLRKQDTWLFSTRPIEISPYNLRHYVNEVDIAPPGDYALLCNSGYGVNSYAMQYYLVYGPLAMFLFLGWGGVYMDAEAAASQISRCFALADQVVSQTQRAKFRAGGLLTIVCSDFYGSYWLQPGQSRPTDDAPRSNPETVLSEVIKWLREYRGKTMEHRVGDIVQTQKGTCTIVDVDGQRITLRTAEGVDVIMNDPGHSTHPRPSKTHRVRTQRFSFDGFQPSDFKANVTGTSYRSREHLGGSVTARIECGSASFNSYPVLRTPEIHWADTAVWDKKNPAYHAKLRVRVSEDSLRFGLFVERQASQHPISDDWRRFSTWLATEAAHEMLTGITTVPALTMRAGNKDFETVLRPTQAGWMATSDSKTETIARNDLGHYLDAVSHGRWLGVDIEKLLARDAAVELKSNVAKEIADTFNTVLPVYRVITQSR